MTAETVDLVAAAIRAAEDKKAFNIRVLDVSQLTSYTDVFVLCSAANPRQVQAIADGIGRRLRDLGRHPLHVEGKNRSEWVLLDFGELIIHLFTEEKRGYYALDALWGDAPRVESADLEDENDPHDSG